MRCHSQAITIKLTHDVPLPEIKQAIATHNEWVSVVPNNKEDTLKNLSPAAINGSLRVPVTSFLQSSPEPHMSSAEVLMPSCLLAHPAPDTPGWPHPQDEPRA